MAGSTNYASFVFAEPRNGNERCDESDKSWQSCMLARPWATGKLAYQDYLFRDVAELERWLPVLNSVLARDGHRLRLDQCSVWIPANDVQGSAAPTESREKPCRQCSPQIDFVTSCKCAREALTCWDRLRGER